jgi:hypothetical protein
MACILMWERTFLVMGKEGGPEAYRRSKQSGESHLVLCVAFRTDLDLSQHSLYWPSVGYLKLPRDTCCAYCQHLVRPE